MAFPLISATKIQQSSTASRGHGRGQQSRVHSGYAGISSTASDSSQQSSIYNASLVQSSDENAGPSSRRKITNTTQAWPDKQRKNRETDFKGSLPRHDPQCEPPPLPFVPNETMMVEARFSNRPDGTPLATILEQKSRLSLRKRLSIISARRSFTPIRASSSARQVYAVGDTENGTASSPRLSLDDVALYRIHESSQNQNSSDTGPSQDNTGTAARQHDNKGIQAHVPRDGPFTRTKTPPGTPRWPGDLLPDDQTPPSRSQRFAHALRSLSLLPSLEATQISSVQSQQSRTSKVPERVRRGRWRPPRSAHSTPNFSGATHPFYHAPIATPVGRDAVNQSRPVPQQSAKFVQAAEDWSQANALMADIVADLHGLPDRTSLEHITMTTPESHWRTDLLGSTSMTILPVRDSSLNFTSQISAESLASQAADSVLTPRDDLMSCYTPDGIPIYSSGPTSTQCREQTTVQTVSGDVQRRVCLKAAPGTATRQPSSSGRAQYQQPEAGQYQSEILIVSAALPVLLPIAAREGIVRPIHMTPRSTRNGESTEAGESPTPRQEKGWRRTLRTGMRWVLERCSGGEHQADSVEESEPVRAVPCSR